MNIIQIIDKNIYNYIYTFNNIRITSLMIVISELASAITFIGLTIIFILILKNKRYSLYIALNLTLVFILNRILKTIINRERPDVLKLVSAKGYSFPSGHSMVAMGFYGFLIYLTYKKIENKKIKYPLIILLSFLILFVGISRVYLGVHFATDVIGGFIIGLIYLLIFIKCIKNKLIIKE